MYLQHKRGLNSCKVIRKILFMVLVEWDQTGGKRQWIPLWQLEPIGR